MSLMQRFLGDRDEVSAWAWEAAGLASPDARMAEIGRLCAHCGDLAAAYHQPVMVAEMLVAQVTYMFIEARSVGREEVAV
ncbi:hypothetical protein ACFV98_11890 [Streptomyces violascens]|uniref:hypothetical protein n=1 Tax=Streptomyces violascens TaxID=67381 RepID=UPI00365F80F7